MLYMLFPDYFYEFYVLETKKVVQVRNAYRET